MNIKPLVVGALNLASRIGSQALGATGARATQIKLQGFTPPLNTQSMDWLRQAGSGVAEHIANFIISAVMDGKISRSHSDADHSQFYKTTESPSRQNGPPVGLRFDGHPGPSNFPDSCNLSAVHISDAGPGEPPAWLSAPISAPDAATSSGSQASPLVRRGAIKRSNTLQDPPVTPRPALPARRTSLGSTMPPAIAAAMMPAKKTTTVPSVSPADKFLKDLSTARLKTVEITPWDDLAHEMKQVYGGDPMAYELDITQQMSSDTPLAEVLSANHMRVVANSGATATSINNCFLISVMQHSSGNYGQVSDDAINQYRSILNDAKLIVPDEKMTSASPAAKAFIELINHDSDPKLDVHMVSTVNGDVFIDRNWKDDEVVAGARKVFIMDKGGHFEAIAERPR